jgi:mannose-6-phosphate isomerase-like protein (cupin superfamily)
MKTFLSIVSVIAVTFCLVDRALAQDPVKVAPKNYRVAFKNDRVRLLDVTVKPGGKVPLHSHPDYLTYAITAAKAKFTMADGTSKEISVKAGECRWTKGQAHAVENTGKTDIHVLDIEFKK